MSAYLHLRDCSSPEHACLDDDLPETAINSRVIRILNGVVGDPILMNRLAALKVHTILCTLNGCLSMRASVAFMCIS